MAETGLNLTFFRAGSLSTQNKANFKTPLSEKMSLFSSELHYSEVLALPIICPSRICQPTDQENLNYVQKCKVSLGHRVQLLTQAGLASKLDRLDQGLVQSSTVVF